MCFAQKRGKLFGVPTGAHPLPWMGPDAPTTARKVGLLPRGGQYFLSKRKKVPKKASGTATTGKSPLLPILTAGLAMSRAMELDSFHLRLERARARLFPPSKWAGLFPSAAYRRSAPPQLAWGIRSPCRDSASVAVDGGQTYPLRGDFEMPSAKRQGAAPDPRAARPVAERR